MKKNLAIVMLILFSLFFVTWLFNEAAFLYNTPSAYTEIPLSSLSSPEYSRIHLRNKKSGTCVMLLHGFKSTPFQFSGLAPVIAERYNVIAPLYPGHGMPKEDFKKYYFTQWYAAARKEYLAARKEYGKVVLCGLSMGGTIALKLAAEFSSDDRLRPDGVITMAAPVFMNNLLGAGVLYDWRLYLVRFISWFTEELPNPADKSDKDGSFSAMPEEIELRHFPAQVYSFKTGLAGTKKCLSKVSAPLLLMHSVGDKTVPFENMAYIRKHVSSTSIKEKVFDLRGYGHNRHLLHMYNSVRPQVESEILNFIDGL